MKRNLLKTVLCSLLVIALLAAPVSGLASSNLALIMKVNGDWVRVRDGADEGAQVITRLRKGNKVLFWGDRQDEMYKICTSSGDVGYIYKGYLSTYGAMKKSQVYVTSGTTKLYKRSGSSLKGNGTLGSGKYVVVYKTSGNWAYIKTMTGKSAYCQKSMLKKAF